MKTINNNQLRLSDINKKVTLFGFVANKRKMGEITFIDLRDRWGITQIILRQKPPTFTKESILKVSGIVKKRQTANPELPTGQIEVEVETIEVLALASPLPFIIHDQLEANEDTKLEHRYLDLRRPIMQKNLKLRHQIIKAMRDFFDNEDFLEIETPLLSKSTPEGARDFLVPTRKQGQFFALPQSPQLYKQLLMASGVERYFQIARTFRDEDSRKDRQPEFTQLDLEMSFVEPEDIKVLIEKMFQFLKQKFNLPITLPFPRMDFEKALNIYGTDKPDLRFDLPLQDVKAFFANTQFQAFAKAEAIKMIYFEQELSNKQLKKVEEIAKKNKASGLMWANFNDLSKGPAAKLIPTEIAQIKNHFNFNKGMIFLVADLLENVNQALGAMRVTLNEMFNLARDEWNFVWIENWPLFEKDPETEQITFAHNPFTSPIKENMNNFAKDPITARAAAYDLVLNGFEIGSGAARITDLEVQKQMFATIGLKPEQYEKQFGFFLEAFKFGFPPHAGFAFGLDRLIMIWANASSIREVIAFPKTAKAISLMEKAPSQVLTEQLDEYGLKIKNKLKTS